MISLCVSLCVIGMCPVVVGLLEVCVTICVLLFFSLDAVGWSLTCGCRIALYVCYCILCTTPCLCVFVLSLYFGMHYVVSFLVLLLS